MDTPRKPHQSDLRKGRYSEPFGLYFVTKRVEAPYNLNERQQEDICNALLHVRRGGRLGLHALVVMRDHWHALYSLALDATLSEVMTKICRFARFNWRAAGSDGYEWQEGFHDHKVHPEESVVDIVRYIEGNPVRKGYVATPGKWNWSSAHPRYASELDRSWLGSERWEPRS